MMVKSLAIALALAAVLGACGEPEDNNPAERCSEELACPLALACYRGFCIERDDALATNEDAGAERLVDAAVDAATRAIPVGARPTDAAASHPSAADAARAPLERPESTLPSVESPSSPPAVTAPDASHEGKASAPEPDARPSEMSSSDPVVATPVPTSPVDPALEAGAWLINLVQIGLLPTRVLTCAPECLTLEPQNQCEKCLDKALKGEEQEVDCEQVRGNRNDRVARARCMALGCSEKECEK